jgi:ribonucleoside-diphosphate reductase alpha chain
MIEAVEKEGSLLQYFKGDELAASVWKSKYAIEGEETPDDMHRRLAKEFARIEEGYILKCGEGLINKNLSDYGQKRNHLREDVIYNLFKDFKYIVPQGSIMSQLGAPNIGSLSNCFVIGQPEDSYGGIFQKDQEMAQLMKRRGGVGLDISTLRPVGTSTSNAAKSSTGAVSFMDRFSNTTREVAQNGRRGALMLTIDCRHPDVLDFINVKKDRIKVTGANISVMLRDDFMEAVKNDKDYILRFPCDADVSFTGEEYNKLYTTVIDRGAPFNKENKVERVMTKKVKAKEIYDSIVENAWDNAEPGQMFIDHHHNYSPDGVYPQFRGICTNPCGEIFMQAYDACRLIAVNLYSFVDNPFTPEARFNYKKFYEVNYEAMRLSDDLIDLELEHIDRILDKIKDDPETIESKETEFDLWTNIKKTAKASRRTGLGFTALGDMLAALGHAYDSEIGLEIIEDVMYHKMLSELDCTTDLAILRGPFTGWNKYAEFYGVTDSINEGVAGGNNSFYKFIIEEFPEQAERMYKYGRRNVSWSTIAPTGTVSLMTQTTSGLEPLFAPFYMRKKKVNPNDEEVRIDFTDANGDNWQEYAVMHPKFKEWIVKYMHLSNDNFDYCEEDLKELFKKSPWYGSTANDIDWIQRIKIQGILQKYITHSISSTINLPKDVSKEEVSKIYMAAFEEGLKGVTIYRDTCRDGVLTLESSIKTKGFEQHDSPKRTKILSGNIHRTAVKGTEYLVIVGFMDNHPYEVFAIRVNGFDVKGNHLYCDIIKVKKGQYDIGVKQDEGVLLIQDFTSHMTPDEEDLTRMISTSLRHGAKIDFVVEQLNKSKGSLVDFSKAIARMLSKHVSIKQEGNCPECETGILRKEEGCTKCDNCYYSAC